MTDPGRGVRAPFAGRRVVFGVTGGIAAYKSIGVARELTLAGADVDVVLTAGAREFVVPLSFEALTGRPVHFEPYTPGDPLLHIRLAREAELVLVAPATANFIARAAAGMADDLLTTILLATTAPVVFAPAMNDRMYAHAQTRENVARLEALGYRRAGPGHGLLAWGEGEGEGRLIDPTEILAHAARALTGETPLSNRRVLVTAGPTREAIDPVRYIGNRSSGRMGFAIASAAARMGADVVLVAGPGQIPPPTGVSVVPVETAAEMHAAVTTELPRADVLVMAAAVADFRPASAAEEKIKKDGRAPHALELEPTVDILRDTKDIRNGRMIVVGFALETENAVANGRRKLEDKALDILVVNDAREPGAGFEVSTNRVTILGRDGTEEELPLLSKDEVADRILERVGKLLVSSAR